MGDEMETVTFITGFGENRTLWSCVPGVSWSAGLELGRDRANNLVSYMTRSGDTALFGRVCEAISTLCKGEFGAVEVGFFQRIADLTVSGRPS